MAVRRSIRLKLRRNELLDWLDLADGVHLAQITVGNDGEIDFLLEGEDLPPTAHRGRAPDFAFECIREDGTLEFYDGDLQIRNPQNVTASVES